MTRTARAALSLGAGAALLAAGAYAAARADAVPYNVRELFAGGHAAATALGLAAVAYWVFGGPAALAAWLGAGRAARAALFPAAVAAHAALAWFALRAAVPLESLDDVVGSPVLRWPWEWEPLGRFVALLGAATVLGTGAAALAAALWGEPRRWAAVRRWAISAAILLPIAHFVVVSRAATDNLTELMAGGGGPAASVAISAAVFLVCFAGATLARLGAGARRVPAAAVAVLLSAPAAYAALALGLESHVEKYGQVFSALQFLLSRDRVSLAGGAELLARYVTAHAVAVLLIALTQHPPALLGGGRGAGAARGSGAAS